MPEFTAADTGPSVISHSGANSHRTNKWGLYHWEIDNYTPKPSYFCLGLLSKFFRGPAEAYNITSTDTLMRMAAIKNLENGSRSIAVINRNDEPRIIDLKMKSSDTDKPFRKYLYDPENVPFNYFGDLQPYSEKISVKNGIPYGYNSSSVTRCIYHRL